MVEDRAPGDTSDCDGEIGIVTDYTYDRADRLVHVCADAAFGCTQQRTFTDYARGMLTTEQHPELGSTGNGSVSYTYDICGNVLTRDYPGTWEKGRVYTYDRVGRLVLIDESASLSTTRALKQLYGRCRWPTPVVS